MSESRDLFVVDLSNPDQPGFASVVVTNDPNGWWGNMKVINNTLYTTHYVWPTGYVQNPTVRYYLDSIDLTDRKNPKVQASINVPGILVGGSPDGSVLYTIDYHWDTNGSYAINDFDALKLYQGRAYLQSRTQLDGWVGNVFVRGTTAYTSTQKYVYTNNQPGIELHQIDLSNPTQPVDRVASGPGGWGWLVDVQGDRLLVTSGWGYWSSPPGLDIYRLSPTAAPVYDQFVRTLVGRSAPWPGRTTSSFYRTATGACKPCSFSSDEANGLRLRRRLPRPTTLSNVFAGRPRFEAPPRHHEPNGRLILFDEPHDPGCAGGSGEGRLGSPHRRQRAA